MLDAEIRAIEALHLPESGRLWLLAVMSAMREARYQDLDKLLVAGAIAIGSVTVKQRFTDL